MLLPASDRITMRILGNSLACQQSTMVLALAVQATPVQVVEPAECVQLCIQQRMTASNCLLLEVAEGWLMCHQNNVGELMSRHSLRTQILPRLQVPGDCFQSVHIASGQGRQARRMHCRVSVHLDLARVLERLAKPQARVYPLNEQGVVCVDSMEPLQMQLVQPCTPLQAHDPCLQVIAQGVHYFLHRQQPDIFIQLYQVFTTIPGHTRANIKCYDLAGSRQHTLQDMPAVVLAVPCVEGFLQEVPFGPSEVWQSCRALPHVCALTIEVPSAHAEDWWLAFPFHFVEALGYEVEYSVFPPPPDSAWLVNLHHAGRDLPYSLQEVCRWLRVLLFLAPVRFAASSPPQSPVGQVRNVDVQVVATTIWTGALPVDTLPEQLEDWRATASVCVGLDPNSRLYSGAYALPCKQPLREVSHCTGLGQIVRRRTGNLLLSLMPALYGGGTKTDKRQTAESQLAQLCLANGFTLDDATRTTAQLVQQVGQQKVCRALEVASRAQQWDQVLGLIQSSGIRAPAPSEVAARVTRRVNAHVKRRQQFASAPKAADFMLAGNFFLNQDGSEAAVLKSLAPRSSGVILLDCPEAMTAISDLAPFGPDEFGVVCLGHQCPHESSCQQKLRFPATARGDDGHVLLMGCFHNLGERKLIISTKQVDEVDVPETVSCTFAAFSDEWPDEASWKALVASPVRTILDLFRQDGVSMTVMRPWGRMFKLDGKVTSPVHANTVQFQAHVAKDSLDLLLRLSGHTQAYVIPKDAEGQILPGWAVVWGSASKAEAKRSSLGIRDQAGIVRSKDRYGVRVPEATYDAAYRLLRPNSEPQPRVQVRFLYKLCPVPAGATEPAIVRWAALQQWQVKVLKALGPRAWLVGSSSPAPEGWLTFNKETILTIPVQQKAKAQLVVPLCFRLRRHMQRRPRCMPQTRGNPWTLGRSTS